MAINQNHLFEELNGIKCGIVEKNVSKERVEFLKQILEYNHYTVVVVPSPPAKTVAPVGAKPAPAATSTEVTNAEASTQQSTPVPPAPETFTVGVTDVTF